MAARRRLRAAMAAGHRHPPQPGPQSAAPGAQEPGHLPAPPRQALPVPGPENQLGLQQGGSEAPLHEPNQPPPALPVPPDPDDEAAGALGQDGGCGGDSDRRHPHPGRPQAQTLRPAGDAGGSEPHPALRRLHPDAGPARHGLPQGQRHRPALRTAKGEGGVSALREGAGDPPQPHQALRALQGPQVRASAGAPGESGLQELNPPKINRWFYPPPPSELFICPPLKKLTSQLKKHLNFNYKQGANSSPTRHSQRVPQYFAPPKGNWNLSAPPALSQGNVGAPPYQKGDPNILPPKHRCERFQS